MRIILGSQSPRRVEILSYFSLDFEQKSSGFDESSIPFEGDPVLYVEQLAKAKAAELSVNFLEALIITADTIVYREGKLYEKPRDREESFQMLEELSGKSHSVWTAVAVSRGSEQWVEAEETLVHFCALSSEQIHQYQSSLHCLDKSGGYAAQGAGGLIVSHIEGCHYNVVGLPIQTLERLLKQAGVSLWGHLKES